MPTIGRRTDPRAVDYFGELAEWVDQTDRFIEFSERPVLAGAGTISTSRSPPSGTPSSIPNAAPSRPSRPLPKNWVDLTALTKIERERITRKQADGHHPTRHTGGDLTSRRGVCASVGAARTG